MTGLQIVLRPLWEECFVLCGSLRGNSRLLEEKVLLCVRKKLLDGDAGGPWNILQEEHGEKDLNHWATSLALSPGAKANKNM